VDNDATGTAQATVNEFLKWSSLQLIYDIEPQQNIALARNRAFTHATANYVAFVDDDEYVEETWLQSLLDCARRFEADAVFGPVVPVYAPGTPKWRQFFARPRYMSGTPVRGGFTGNVLVRFRGSSYQYLRFDEKFGLTGGEDFEFFTRMYKKGGKLIWSDEAIVYEHVPPYRTTVRWLVGRAYRGGQTFARVHLPEMSKVERVQWLAQRICLLTIASFGLSLWFVKRRWGVTALRKIASSIGQLCWKSKNPFKEYEKPRS
jgi:succinoglycan biosynthesis protein ExoM